MIAGTAPNAGNLTSELAHIGAALLHQQCWCWGCDLRRPEGNLLLQYGFERSRPPRRDYGSSRYILRIDSQGTLHLWGFGAAWQEGDGATFIARYEFQPAALLAESLAGEIWVREQLLLAPSTPNRRLQSLTQAARFCRFNAAYERWVVETAGPSYRDNTRKSWTTRLLAPGSLREPGHA
jgi:hypothetical protein